MRHLKLQRTIAAFTVVAALGVTACEPDESDVINPAEEPGTSDIPGEEPPFEEEPTS